MRRTTAVWLVARREIVERGRSRGYLISLVVTIGLLVAGFVVPQFVDGDTRLRLALVGGTPQGLAAAAESIAAAQDRKLVVSSAPDLAAAREQLRAKEIDGALDVPADLSGPGTLYFQERPSAPLQLIATSAVVALRAGATAAPPATQIIAPPGDDETTSMIFATAGIILMFIGIFTYGTWVLTGVVEEKQSRVVEVVLSTVRPRDLLMGKVLGIGSLAIAHLAVLVAVALAVSRLVAHLTLPPATVGSVAQLVLWFVLGFLLYATSLGALGSLASRPEEANNAAMPVTMVAVFSYMASLVLVTESPDSPLAQAMTFIPFSAPMVVPLRVALSAIEPWEVALSVAIMLVAVWLLFEAGARVYSGAVLASGGRMKLREAWRARR